MTRFLRSLLAAPATAVVTASLIAVAGCSLLKGPTRYDPVEVVSYVELWQWGQRLHEGCGNREMEHHALAEILITAERLTMLTKYGPDDDSRAVFAGVQKVIAEVRAGGSKMFCAEAATNVKAAAERALRAVGARPR